MRMVWVVRQRERAIVGSAKYRNLVENAHDLSYVVAYQITWWPDMSLLWRIQLRAPSGALVYYGGSDYDQNALAY